MTIFTKTASFGMALIMISFAVESAAPQQLPNALGEGVEAAVNGGSSAERYIVVLKDPPMALYDGGLPGLAPTSARVTGTRRLDAHSDAARAYKQHLRAGQEQALGAIAQRLGRNPATVFRYTVATNGFAVDLSAEEARAVATLPGVRTVEREQVLQVHSDQGPQWINADLLWDHLDPLSRTAGEGILIGILDTGLNLDHPSFAAVGGNDGYVHTNPFGSGVYLGLCASDPATFICNDKLVGYRIFTGELTEDTEGHGSWVASVAAGNSLATNTVNLNPWTDFSPAISGVARHANLIGYDVCYGGCPGSATLAGIDQAVLDGVDVINYSIGGGENSPWTNTNAQAMLAAGAAGVIVVSSAGNAGPGVSTVNSPANAPWVLAVGAATHPRATTNTLVASGGNGTPPSPIVGTGLSNGLGPAPIVYAGDFGDSQCLSPFPPGTWASGEIVVCDRGTISRVSKGWNVLVGGAGGLVLVNGGPGDSLNNDVHHLPAVHVDSVSGAALKAWIAAGGAPLAHILGASVDVQPANADLLAPFSSRGPSLFAGVLKPDLSAPGFDILGAFSSTPPNPDIANSEYTIGNGTSFASPHVAGAAALVRALNPTWTPAEVRSALASAAAPTIVVDDGGLRSAQPFEAGAGRADVAAAATAGLTMDETGAAFTAADPATGGDPTALNLPSLVSDSCCGCSWTRTFDVVTAGTYDIISSGVPVTATPSSFTVSPGESQQVVFTASTGALPPGDWSFGAIEISEHFGQASSLRFPVAVMPGSTTPLPDLMIIASEPTGTELVAGLEAPRDVTDLTYTTHGLVRGIAVDENLSQDPTNGDPYDNLNDGTTFVVPVSVPAGAQRLVAEIVESTAPDMDLFVGSGLTPSAATQLCSSTTSTALESCKLDDPPSGDYWILVQNWAQSAAPPDDVRLSYGVIAPDLSDGELAVAGPAGVVPGCTSFDAAFEWYVPTPVDGDRFYGLVTLGSSLSHPDDIGSVDVAVAFDGVESWLLCRTPGLAIPDGGAVSDFASFSENLTLTDVTVHIVSDHTWVGDLIFTLEHLGGATSIVIDRPGYPATDFGCGEDGIDVVVDDLAGADLEGQCDIGPAISGRRIGGDPPGPVMAAFRGEDLAGDWSMTVADNVAQDTGSLISWCLEVSLNSLFSDGFESGDLGLWSNSTP